MDVFLSEIKLDWLIDLYPPKSNSWLRLWDHRPLLTDNIFLLNNCRKSGLKAWTKRQNSKLNWKS